MDDRSAYLAGLFMATGVFFLRRGFTTERWFQVVRKCLESEIEDHDLVIELMQKMYEDAAEVAFISEVLGLKGFPEASSVVDGARERLKEIIEGERHELH